jgi:hypothetical protein
VLTNFDIRYGWINCVRDSKTLDVRDSKTGGRRKVKFQPSIRKVSFQMKEGWFVIVNGDSRGGYVDVVPDDKGSEEGERTKTFR